MAIIVEHKTTRESFVLLGAGLGMYKSARPGVIGGDLFPRIETGQVGSVAVCNATGEIKFLDKALLRVVSVDGMAIGEILDQAIRQPSDHEYCPACNALLPVEAMVCPSCGLNFAGGEVHREMGS